MYSSLYCFLPWFHFTCSSSYSFSSLFNFETERVSEIKFHSMRCIQAASRQHYTILERVKWVFREWFSSVVWIGPITNAYTFLSELDIQCSIQEICGSPQPKPLLLLLLHQQQQHIAFIYFRSVFLSFISNMRILILKCTFQTAKKYTARAFEHLIAHNANGLDILKRNVGEWMFWTNGASIGSFEDSI